MSQAKGIRTGAWSQSQTLRVDGRELGGSPGFVTQCSFWDPDDERQRPAGMYTVQFNVDTSTINPLTGFSAVNAEAIVDFSAEGNTVRRRLSIVNGTSISGVADHVEVRVRDVSIRPPVEPPPLLDYTVTVTIAPYTRADRAGVPCYLAAGIPIPVASGATVAVAIPGDAGATSLFVSTASTGGGVPFIEQVRGADGVTMASYDPRDIPSGFIPLFPGVTFIRLGNTGPALSVVTYSLLLGIDG